MTRTPTGPHSRTVPPRNIHDKWRCRVVRKIHEEIIISPAPTARAVLPPLKASCQRFRVFKFFMCHGAMKKPLHGGNFICVLHPQSSNSSPRSPIDQLSLRIFGAFASSHLAINHIKFFFTAPASRNIY
jgi:hypothetical protein